MSFIHDDFLLPNPASRRLFHEVAKSQPIIDYHCHLPPQEVAENRQFADLAEIWLGGDHYKWRAMRAAGIPESLITDPGADPRAQHMAGAVAKASRELDAALARFTYEAVNSEPAATFVNAAEVAVVNLSRALSHAMTPRRPGGR